MLGTIAEGILKWKATRNLDRVTRATSVAVCSRKGGVGKTTTAVHLAVAAARWHYKRVLLVDMDPQGHVAASLTGVLRHERMKPLSEVFLDKKGDLVDACVSTSLHNLWIVPADDRLEQIQMMLSTRIGREFVLKSAMEKAEDMFDLIVFDCPPNLETLTVNALVASQSVLVPTDLSLLAVEGVGDIAEAVETIRERLGLPVEVAGVIVTRVDGRNKVVNREVTGLLSRRFGRLVMDTRVGSSTSVLKACLDGKPVFDFAPDSRAAQDLKAACDELLDRMEA